MAAVDLSDHCNFSVFVASFLFFESSDFVEVFFESECDEFLTQRKLSMLLSIWLKNMPPVLKSTHQCISKGSDEIEEEQKEILRNFFLITAKPVLYACNISDADLPEMKNKYTEQVLNRAKQEKAQAIPICAKIEAELSELSDEDQLAFLKDLGLSEPGLNRLIKASYDLLGLITFLTAGEDESRAWTIKKGFLAPQAAGVIHTDFERGFIRAEVMAYDDLFKLGNDKAVKEAGLLRSEGKDYVVRDGDIIEFKFNV